MSLRHVETRPTPPDCRADSKLDLWDADGRRFFVLAQRGTFPDVCYDHGRLLAHELERGVFPEILATIADDVDPSAALEGGFLDQLLGAFFNRLSRDVLGSCSDDFRGGVEALAQGYAAGVPQPAFDAEAVRHACVAIDTGNVATGFTRINEEMSGSAAYSYWRNYATEAWTSSEAGRSYPDATGRAHDDVPIDDWLRRGLRQRAGMGCTGFWAAPGLTADGPSLHARNFDGAFFQWNDYPVLSVIDERDSDAGYLRYAAVGTAGLIYPGGINGMNEAGIAVSLHQMSTVNFTTGDHSGRYDVAPYVQQRILREARTLDEAVAIARARRHFASWTILVSHAPSGRALRIEMNGRERTGDAGAKVFGDTYEATVRAGEPSDRMVQTNHFLAHALRERHDFFGDAHFTKTVGKWIETRARMATAEAHLDAAVDAGTLDTPGALALLANHDDHAAGGARRSFGRTICKAYSLVSGVMRASPDRTAPADQIWFTVGADDRATPGPHTTLAGFALDWDGLTATALGTHRADTVTDAELWAMRHYVAAFTSHDRPRQPDGSLFRRKPTDAEMQTLRKLALESLDRAVAVADDAGLSDPAFRYVRARVRHDAALAAAGPERADLLQRAADDWAALRTLADAAGTSVTDWERTLIHLLSAATETARGRLASSEIDALVRTGRDRLERVARERFGDGREHRDIESWRAIAAALADGDAPQLPGIDFVTVE